MAQDLCQRQMMQPGLQPPSLRQTRHRSRRSSESSATSTSRSDGDSSGEGSHNSSDSKPPGNLMAIRGSSRFCGVCGQHLGWVEKGSAGATQKAPEPICSSCQAKAAEKVAEAPAAEAAKPAESEEEGMEVDEWGFQMALDQVKEAVCADDALAVMEGCEYVFHTASPFFFGSESEGPEAVEAKLIKPAVDGTKNVLGSVAKHKADIKCVALTSSCAAISGFTGTDKIAREDGKFSEADWNALVDSKPSAEFLEAASWSTKLSEVQSSPSADLRVVACAKRLASIWERKKRGEEVGPADAAEVSASVAPTESAEPRAVSEASGSDFAGSDGGLGWTCATTAETVEDPALGATQESPGKLPVSQETSTTGPDPKGGPAERGDAEQAVPLNSKKGFLAGLLERARRKAKDKIVAAATALVAVGSDNELPTTPKTSPVPESPEAAPGQWVAPDLPPLPPLLGPPPFAWPYPTWPPAAPVSRQAGPPYCSVLLHENSCCPITSSWPILGWSRWAFAGTMVFTGIVEEMGTVLSVEKKANLEMWDGSKSEGFVLKIKCEEALKGAYIGCSIAVNGTCLTVTTFNSEAQLSFELAW
ncbi:putative uncharacterized oxidoreductase [Symbiodinium microadriaticum]|uniref:Uncharacterized oxidoreductase n=1 Tax=Symbiodinium microadriaticum TaxID=2951 RepID=A0A1Q9EPZ8_SYMMI|nr:putative uncharacterized oxidoreductase [Symbiodinium microadriaticum]